MAGRPPARAFGLRLRPGRGDALGGLRKPDGQRSSHACSHSIAPVGMRDTNVVSNDLVGRRGKRLGRTRSVVRVPLSRPSQPHATSLSLAHTPSAGTLAPLQHDQHKHDTACKLPPTLHPPPVCLPSLSPPSSSYESLFSRPSPNTPASAWTCASCFFSDSSWAVLVRYCVLILSARETWADREGGRWEGGWVAEGLRGERAGGSWSDLSGYRAGASERRIV